MTFFTIFTIFWEFFLKILKILKILQFWQFWHLWTIFDNVEFFGNFLYIHNFLTILDNFYNDNGNPRGFWPLRHWLQFWQLRTWIHDSLCDLTIKSDTGQHLQFLRCLRNQKPEAYMFSPAKANFVDILANIVGRCLPLCRAAAAAGYNQLQTMRTLQQLKLLDFPKCQF